MSKLFTREQARQWLRDNNLKDGKSIQNAFIAEIKDILQEALEEEITQGIGYSKYDWKNKPNANSRNGHTKKTVKSKFGEIELKIPRDVNGDFEPVIVKKHERTITTELEDLIIALYAKGISNRDIEAHMQQVYGLEVSAETVTRITDKILPIAREWQTRQLNEIYPIIYLDGILFSVNQDGHVIKKTVYLVYAITLEGKKDVLGIWIGEAESAKFWMTVLADLKNRGVKDILIASVDGLKGFETAIESIFPQTEVQQCIVHQIRNSTKFVNYKDRKAFCDDMKEIYTAPNEEGGMDALDRFEDKWGGKYSYEVKSWRANWTRLSTFFKYPPEIRRLMYTTNPIENLNRGIRKITKNKGSFPTDDSLFKILYLIIMDISQKWTLALPNWGMILNQLHVYFGERLERYL
jgi:transposase-like protein